MNSLVTDAIKRSAIESGQGATSRIREIVLRPRTGAEFGQMAQELREIKERGNDSGGSIYSQFRVSDDKLTHCDGVLNYWSFESLEYDQVTNDNSGWGGNWSVRVEMPWRDRRVPYVKRPTT